MILWSNEKLPNPEINKILKEDRNPYNLAIKVKIITYKEYFNFKF